MRAPAEPLTVATAAEIIRQGGLVAIPTETVYGLAADAANPDAVLAIYEAKGRPRFNPLIVHCADRAMAGRLADFAPLAQRLAEKFWPGPLTLVMPLNQGANLAALVTAGLSTVAVRVPAHPLAHALIEAVGRPVAAPSANPSGRLSPTTAQAVREAFAGKIPVLDGGPSTDGVESTIVAAGTHALVLLRPGAITRAEIEAATGVTIVDPAPGAKVASPGRASIHYAPATPLRLAATSVEPGEALLAFGSRPPGTAGPMLNLSEAGDLREAARNLFAHLAALDRAGATAIAVMPIPDAGLGEAINDRLRRAAGATPVPSSPGLSG
ncbi:MAG: L-threonylcarbamoyladenylate synthase [Cucumibacter sp.]